MNKQVVTVDYKKFEGLILNWNFIDLKRTSRFLRHFIIVGNTDQSFAAFLIEDYVGFMKPGDLYSVLFFNSSGKLKFKGWREKTYSTDLSESALLGDGRLTIPKWQEVFEAIQKQLQQSSVSTILNFILNDEQTAQQVKKHIQIRQRKGLIKFISTIFSPMRGSFISISQGINRLCINDRFFLSYYHHYLSQMAAEHAHLTIQCSNGVINSYTQEEWINTSFNKVERHYYGPSIRYRKDVLHFINSKRIRGGSYELNITLTYQHFDGNSYTSHKKVKVAFDQRQNYHRTVVCGQSRPRYYESIQDFQLQENPYESDNIIYFDPITGPSDQQPE